MCVFVIISSLSSFHYVSNGQLCNNTFPWPNTGYIGIQTNAPQMPLHIHGDTNCPIVTERLSYGDINNLQYLGHLALLTPATINSYTLCPNRGLGDIILQSQIGRENGGNIILNIKDETKKIILATSPFNGSPEFERLKVFPSGKSEFNTGLWNWGLPKITLSSEETKPTIKFYQPTGTQPLNEYGSAYPWYIQTNENSMHFQWGQFANIGNESVSTKVVFNLPNPIDGNIRVGINTGSTPLAMLHGTNGSVLFDGDIGSVPVTGAGTRFMWIPSLKAIRAGEVTGTQWDNIGEYSVAFGKNSISKGENAISIGFSNKANDKGCIAMGSYTISEGNGDGINDENEGYNTAIGNYATAKGLNNNAIGFFVEARGIYPEGGNSTALGNYVSTNNKRGSFIIGDMSESYGLDIFGESNNNINQIMMKFCGTPLNDDPTNISYLFITGYVGKDLVKPIGVALSRKSNGWITYGCDSNLKREISIIDKFDILNRIMKIPIKSWKWKGDSVRIDGIAIFDTVGYKWLGPMAQDFSSVFSEFGLPDSSLISQSVMDGAMFAGIQALADITDSLGLDLYNQRNQSFEFENKIDSLLSKEEFEKFKDTIYCYAKLCDLVDDLDKNKLSKQEFYNFKDSLYCYVDACKRIEELESLILKLKEEIDSLKAKGITIKANNDNILSVDNQKYEDIILEQNNPNPFSETCQINYYIPNKYNGKAKLVITDEFGRKVIQSHEICNGKPCQMTISAKELITGVYIYGIVLSGRVVKSKKMMIIK